MQISCFLLYLVFLIKVFQEYFKFNHISKKNLNKTNEKILVKKSQTNLQFGMEDVNGTKEGERPNNTSS